MCTLLAKPQVVPQDEVTGGHTGCRTCSCALGKPLPWSQSQASLRWTATCLPKAPGFRKKNPIPLGAAMSLV